MSSAGQYYSYRVPTPPPSTRRLSTSRREVAQIGIAYLVLTVDLVIIFTGSTVLFGTAGSGILQTLSAQVVAVAAAAALTGFVAHELAHKVVAQRHGFWAEFRMSPIGLAISFVTAFLGVLWGAPGATVVSGMGTQDRAVWGKTSLAGPLANFAFAAVFYVGSVVTFAGGTATLSQWLLLLAWINGWFGTFNLLPFGPLDGRKVLRWSPAAWLGGIVLTGSLAVISFLALFKFGTPLFLR